MTMMLNMIHSQITFMNNFGVPQGDILTTNAVVLYQRIFEKRTLRDALATVIREI